MLGLFLHVSTWFFYTYVFLSPSPSERFLPSLPCLSVSSSLLVTAQASAQMQRPAQTVPIVVESGVKLRSWKTESQWENGEFSPERTQVSLALGRAVSWKKREKDTGCMHLKWWEFALRGVYLRTTFFKNSQWPLAASVYSLLLLHYFGTMVGCQS